MAGYLTAEDHRRVSDAVALAESHSAGEIVTIIADQSDGYTDIALAWATGVAFAAMAVFSAVPHFYLDLLERIFGLWSHDWSPREILTIALGIGVLKFIAMVLLQLWKPLKFALIPGRIKTDRAENRAIDLFKVGAERRTQGRTGILIYLSMQEHRAEIVADEAITGKVAPEVWGDAMAALLTELKQGRIADGMIAAVGKVGGVLAEHFPRAEDDRNELPDRLIEL
ncbi:conserved hypothetical protein [Altererythrobacter sp. B11]|uniref:TPM domain-containing protein n=1 Tax=Altererythrobacter sp. B11 TaxID=2060312 RepID=UPI000DC70847|nr:TPM domain-containing protein [Altererythrobacter sp. B11]BBC73883.1 conserved hypothetical protein [Altererythrobacter sp. B11]